MTFASTRPAMRRQFKIRKSRRQRQDPFLTFTDDNCFESVFQMGKAQEAGRSGDVRFTRQVEISKVLCTSTQTVQIKMSKRKKNAMPLCLSDSKGVLGVWRGLITCFWCSVLMNGWVTDTHIVLGTHIGSKSDPVLSEGQEMCVLFFFDSISNVIFRSLA